MKIETVNEIRGPDFISPLARFGIVSVNMLMICTLVRNKAISNYSISVS